MGVCGYGIFIFCFMLIVSGSEYTLERASFSILNLTEMSRCTFSRLVVCCLYSTNPWRERGAAPDGS